MAGIGNLTADVAKIVLSNRTLRWSTPALFNDPFDNQFDISTSQDKVSIHKELCNLLTEDTPTNIHSIQYVISMLKIYKKMSNLTDDDWKNEISQAASESINNIFDGMPKTNAEIKQALADISILCLTENHDNVVMWSHYSGQHTGVVLKLMPLHVDSPLTLARKVKYQKQLHHFTVTDLLSLDSKKVVDYKTLTKSTSWAYEKEWRIITTLRDKSKKFEDILFHKKDLSAVYLGCRISPEDKARIIELIRNNFPDVGIYQAKTHSSEFSLVFDQV